jgi:hypothetical protein
MRSLAPILVIAALLAGCGETKPPEAPTRYRPAAFHPEQFPDIPLFPVAGYEFEPGEDQLAVAFAGGTVRRFEVAMIQRAGGRDDPPEAVLARYDGELAPLGWVRTGVGHWTKGTEGLVIEAGRSGGLTTVRFHLRPLQQ